MSDGTATGVSTADTAIDREPGRTGGTVVAIANQKGGVGKSTTAINLGAALAFQGERVLIVDLDPQGNTSSGLGVDRAAIESSTYDVLVDGSAIDDVLEPTSVRDLYVVPATIELAGAEIELVSMFSREQRLKQSLGPVLDACQRHGPGQSPGAANVPYIVPREVLHECIARSRRAG